MLVLCFPNRDSFLSPLKIIHQSVDTAIDIIITAAKALFVCIFGSLIAKGQAKRFPIAEILAIDIVI